MVVPKKWRDACHEDKQEMALIKEQKPVAPPPIVDLKEFLQSIDWQESDGDIEDSIDENKPRERRLIFTMKQYGTGFTPFRT